MKALSIRQPYAGALASGWKDVENRRVLMSMRGRFLIHAGQQLHATGQRAIAIVEELSGQKVPLLGAPGQATEWTLGAIVGVAEISAAHRGCDGSCSPWAEPGMVHHRIVNARPLRRPVPCPGRLHPFTPDPITLAAVREVWPR